MTAVRIFHGPARPFHATSLVPGDKSLSHRALFLAAMAPGRSRLTGLGPGNDVASTVWALGRFGVTVGGDGVVVSPGIEGWVEYPSGVDAGNSGTTLRLLCGAAAGRPFVTRITGDLSLRRRPMRRLVGPLSALGARIAVTKAGTPPVKVTGGPLQGAQAWIPEASAQVRTAFALAALQAVGPSVMDSPPGYRDHTERWLEALGLGRATGPTSFEISPGAVPPLDVTVPRDPSSAAFLWVAAALGESTVTTPGVSINPGRTGVLDILSAMGAAVEVAPEGDVLGDPVGTVTVRGPVQRGVDVAGELAVRAIDELPLVALLGCAAAGRTVVHGAEELRLKETDRIAAAVRLVSGLGGVVEEAIDGFAVTAGPLRGGGFSSGGDHRMAMAGAVAATIAGTVVVAGMEAADVSWPGFAEALEMVWASSP